MKLRILLLCLMILPNLAMAEIYKWKDKEGVTRYSDVPPPSNVKQEMMQGKKTPKPTGLAPLTEVEGDATAKRLRPGPQRKKQQLNVLKTLKPLNRRMKQSRLN